MMLADRINDELIRLGYSEYTGGTHRLLACHDPQGIVMTHPTRAFDIALYDGEALLLQLQELTEASWTQVQQVLQQTMIHSPPRLPPYPPPSMDRGRPLTLKEVSPMTMETTVQGHHILCWRTLPDGKEEAYIEGYGWCWYSRKLSAILIDGDWITF